MRLLVLFTLIGAAFAVPRQINRIVGGEVTTVETYPYMSNMQYGWFGVLWYQACGGSLLTSRTVLSAAHCYYGDAPSSWRVMLGTSQASSGGSTHEVSGLIVHENYSNQMLTNDVAIVVLSTAAVFSPAVGVARIPGNTYVVPDNAVVTTIGWGTTSSGGQASEQLRHVHINVINQQICAERYAYLKSQPGYQNWPDITDGMLCAGVLDVGGKDACQGDSGGPLAYQNDIIVGVVSWGFGCADPYYPGVNARTSHYSDWIVNNASV